MGLKKCWLVARTIYCKENQVMRFFRSKGLECFLPMRYKEEILETGNKKRFLVPAIHNLAFLHTPCNKKRLSKLMEECPVPLYFMKEKETNDYAIVPDRQMNDFMELTNPKYNNMTIVDTMVIDLKKGDRVRVIKGPFKGIEGKFIHYAGKRCIAVAVPGVAVVFSIPKWYVETIED